MAQLYMYVLNIVASPHPEGVYPRLLRKAARGGGVRARGSDYAKITRLTEQHTGIYTGRILVWTDIDMNGPWVDLIREEELPEDVRRGIRIPSNARPNYRTFRYVFDERRHLFYYEARNQLDEKLGPTIVRRAIITLTYRAQRTECAV